VADWQVLNTRLTVFVGPDTTAPATLFRDVVGEDAESSTFQRAAATRIDTGILGDGTLTLQVQPIRIDWVYEPIGLMNGGPFATLGAFPAGAQPLLQLSDRWVRSNWFPSSQRIALGFILISLVPDRETGYRELAEFVDGVPTDPNATDFQYQVNHPRPSHAGVDGLRINQLAKWSVGAFQSMRVTIGPGTANQVLGPLQYHLRLELDINTAGEFAGPIPQDRIEDVVHELLEGANEVCQHGSRMR